MSVQAATGFAVGFVAFPLLAMVFWPEPWPETEPVTAAAFGADFPEFPECQTDMAMSELWTPRLMYLNGIWTAACIAESQRRKDGGKG